MTNKASVPGTYLLLLECDQKTSLQVGKLGCMMTVPGYYIYVGSAFGPGGIRARIRHHQKKGSRPHWHIDYLRSVARLIDGWCVYGCRYEHEWAQALMSIEKTRIPLQGFGASDCHCTTHLFYFKRKPGKAMLERQLQVKLTGLVV